MKNKCLKRAFLLVCALLVLFCLLALKWEFLFGVTIHSRVFTMTIQHVKILQELKNLSVSNWSSIENTSSAEHSLVVLHNPQKYYCMGEVLNVTVTMMDYNSRPKSYGGDFLLARIYSPTVEASASGVVTDFHNGSYLISFTLFWAGEVRMSVVLVHPSEAVQALWRTRQKSYSKIRHTGYFVNDGKTENTECGFQLSANRSQCFYGDRFSGEFFSCYTPPTLPCHTLDSMSSVNSDGVSFTKKEALLMTRNYIGKEISSNISTIFVYNYLVLSSSLAQTCDSRVFSPVPSGYFWKSQWSSICHKTYRYFTEESIHTCLKGKRLYGWGDSTIRQWIEHLISFQKDYTFHATPGYHSRIMVSDSERNYSIEWHNHGHPWVTYLKNKINETGYISNRLEQIGAQSGDIVVIALGQHFRPYPLQLFAKRMLSLRKAIKRLQIRSPQTRIFIKLENTREMNSDQLRFSNWHGHVQNLIQREVFGDLGVGLVDAWDITVADNTLTLHPKSSIIASELALFLSILCDSV